MTIRIFSTALPLIALLFADLQAKVGKVEKELDLKMPSSFLPGPDASVIIFQVANGGKENVKSRVSYLKSDWSGYAQNQFFMPKSIGLNAIGIQSNGDYLVVGYRPLTELERNGVGNREKFQFQYGLGKVSKEGGLVTDLSLKDLNSASGQQMTRIGHLHIFPDGSLIAGTSVPNKPKAGATLTRFLPDGGSDPGFQKSSIKFPNDFIVLESGNILTYSFKKLHPNGQQDLTFAPGMGAAEPAARRRRAAENGEGMDGQVATMIQQPDGKILISGILNLPAVQEVYSLVRLNSDGSLDAAFKPVSAQQRNGGGQSPILGVVLQADGKIILNGPFKILNGERLNCIARLNGDGTVDSDFDPPRSLAPGTFVLQPNGKILFGNSKLSLLSNDPATSRLKGNPGAGFTWTRGVSAPEVERAFLEEMRDGKWQYHSEMQRIKNGWVTTKALEHSDVRACGIARGSLSNSYYTIVQNL